MKYIKLRLILSFIMLLFTSIMISTFCLAEDAPFPAQMTINIYQHPTYIKADNKYFLVYEIYLTNYMHAHSKIISFSIDGEDQKDLFKTAALNEALHSVTEKQKTAESGSKLNFAPAQSKTIFVWIPFEDQNKIPNNLMHHLTIDSTFQNKKYQFNLGVFNERVDLSHPVIISAPLEGKNWLAVNGPSNTSAHRRAGMILNGRPYYAQRYAIDFIQLGEDGISYKGDIHKNTSYHCYNQDVLAVADGTVTKTQDGIPENVPNSGKMAIPLNEIKLPGNYIIIDVGNGKYVGYAHLIPGSLKVKEGDHVSRNQVIAKLGNSGNSSEPHLHFQIINRNSFLESEGIPYGFEHFYARATQTEIVGGSLRAKMDSTPFKEYNDQLVLENALVNFEK